MNNKITDYLFLIIEVMLFLCMVVFCLGGYWTKPQRLFSLNESLSNALPAFADTVETVDVRLPQSFQSYFRSTSVSAIRLSNTQPVWSNRITPEQTFQIRLSELIPNFKNNGARRHGLFFYLMSLQPTEAVYEIRILDSTSRVQQRTVSGRLPAGEVVWRDSFGSVAAGDAVFQITLDSPMSKAFLCEVVIYNAPGILFWQTGVER